VARTLSRNGLVFWSRPSAMTRSWPPPSTISSWSASTSSTSATSRWRCG
jgi:hypothetical protein